MRIRSRETTMAKKRKKLTSADENLDPDVPTEMELRLEEELRLAYGKEILDEGGSKDAVSVDDATHIERGCDRVEGNRIGEGGGELEKALERLTKEQLVEIVKEAVKKDKELRESVKKKLGFVHFKHKSDNAIESLEQPQKRVSDGNAPVVVEKQHLAEAHDQLQGSSRNDSERKSLPRELRKRKREELPMPDVGKFGSAAAAPLTSYGDQDKLLHHPSWGDDHDYQHKYLPSEYRRGHRSAHRSPVTSEYDTRTPPVGARAFNTDFRQASTSSGFMARKGAADSDYWQNSFPGRFGGAPMNQVGSHYSDYASYVHMQQIYMNPWLQYNEYRQPHPPYIDYRHNMWPFHR